MWNILNLFKVLKKIVLMVKEKKYGNVSQDMTFPVSGLKEITFYSKTHCQPKEL